MALLKAPRSKKTHFPPLKRESVCSLKLLLIWLLKNGFVVSKFIWVAQYETYSSRKAHDVQSKKYVYVFEPKKSPGQKKNVKIVVNLLNLLLQKKNHSFFQIPFSFLKSQIQKKHRSIKIGLENCEKSDRYWVAFLLQKKAQFFSSTV